MKMRALIITMAVVFLLSCSGSPGGGQPAPADSNYHPGLPRLPGSGGIPVQPAPVTSLPFMSFRGIKLAPGAVSAAGHSVAGSYVLSPTEHHVSGTTVGAVISITKSETK